MSKINVVQILKNDGINEDKYKKIIDKNFKFLDRININYIVCDNLESLTVLGFIKNYQIIYFRKKFVNLKTSFLTSIDFISEDCEKVLFLKSDDILTNENIEMLESSRPEIAKKDFYKLQKNLPSNFKFSKFKILIKDKKSLFEKIKLLF